MENRAGHWGAIRRCVFCGPRGFCGRFQLVASVEELEGFMQKMSAFFGKLFRSGPAGPAILSGSTWLALSGDSAVGPHWAHFPVSPSW